ncbi:MAG: hypothetical protein ABIE74_00715 [Pseudomonadota bacterium]
MKKVLVGFVVTFVLAVMFSGIAQAKSPPFPDKGWHKGPYILATGGMMQVTNDKHSVYDRKFDGTFIPSFGLAFGWDIADWIGPMLQITYATATGQTGDPNNINQQSPNYGGNTYPQNTFLIENAREHALDFGIYAKATLPYFTRASWQPNMVKFIPYVKLGGLGHAVFVNAPTNANKAGAVGGGIGFGAGIEMFIWKGLFVGLDVTEAVIFQKGFTKTITTTTGPQSVKITKSGTKTQFNLMGMLGWHF